MLSTCLLKSRISRDNQRRASRWESVVKTPPTDFPDELWENTRKAYAELDRTEVYAGPLMGGVFETVHSLMGMDSALLAFYEEPRAMHDLINVIVEWEMGYAKNLTANLHPDLLFHHDDWGSKLSTFMSVDMFKEFFFKQYQRLYRFYKDNGVEIIIHHSDSYAATLAPLMIEMGIDVWQGAVKENDIKYMIERYGQKLTIMSGIDTPDVDRPDWTREIIANTVRHACQTYGGKYFIPCQTQGGPYSTFEGVYNTISEEIDKMSKEMFQQA